MAHRSLAIAVGIAFLLTGCASLRDGRGALDDANMTCVVVGGLLGGAAGAAAANPNHGDDENDEAILGAAIGAIVGAVVGDYLCGPTTNAAPTVRISAEPRSGERPLAVSFRSVANDPDGSIASYAWDFGDGLEGQIEAVAARGRQQVVARVPHDGHAEHAARHDVLDELAEDQRGGVHAAGVADPPEVEAVAQKAPRAVVLRERVTEHDVGADLLLIEGVEGDVRA